MPETYQAKGQINPMAAQIGDGRLVARLGRGGNDDIPARGAREAWEGSSASLADVFRDLAVSLIGAHAEDLISDGRLSGSNIKEISDLTGVPMAALVLELIKIFARPDSAVPGSDRLYAGGEALHAGCGLHLAAHRA